MGIIDGDIKLKMRAQEQSISVPTLRNTLIKLGVMINLEQSCEKKRLVALWLGCFAWLSSWVCICGKCETKQEWDTGTISRAALLAPVRCMHICGKYGTKQDQEAGAI